MSDTVLNTENTALNKTHTKKNLPTWRFYSQREQVPISKPVKMSDSVRAMDFFKKQESRGQRDVRIVNRVPRSASVRV